MEDIDFPEEWELDHRRPSDRPPYTWCRRLGYKTFCVDQEADGTYRIEGDDLWNQVFNGMTGYATQRDALQALSIYLHVMQHEHRKVQG